MSATTPDGSATDQRAPGAQAHEVWAIVVAAGSGRRFGGAKQFVELSGRPLVAWAVEAMARRCHGVVLVVPPGDVDEWRSLPLVDRVAAGGATRSASVRAGLAAVPSSAEVILVHDGARPLADGGLVERVIGALSGTHAAAAALPGVAVTDTLRTLEGAPVDRDSLVAVQTPQGFRADALRNVHASAPEATDDASLLEAAGHRVVVVDGDPANLKVTAPSDLAVAEALLAERQQGRVADDRAGGSTGEDGAMVTDDRTPVPDLRVGNGFDIHRFSDDPDRRCVLGGVEIPDAPGLVAHSDGDPVAHAIAEALLGATGLGDLGSHFPDTDPAHAGADSMGLLAEVVATLADGGWKAVNVDCSVIAERPKLAPHRAEMVKRLSRVVGAPVSVKGRRAEEVGSLGSGEAIVALASALVVRS
ncbi:MAG: 2-C-methyl-D-erythritol 4-phosphate cytidylyltransferase [Microthrixaceae bacterium]